MRYGCEQCREEVAVRDELSHLERARLAAHLEACTRCRSFASRWAATIESARASAPALTGATKDALLDLIRTRCEPPRARRQIRPIPGWRAAAAVVLSSAALLLFALVRPGPEVAGPLPVPRNDAREGAPRLAAPAPLPAPASPPAAVPRAAVARGARRVQRTAPPAGLEEPAITAPAPAAGIAPSRTGDRPHSLDAGSLYAGAERELAEGRPAEAARILEDLIERAPDTPEAQTARLELGRLYAGVLKRPARAVAHLSAFVAREPEPSAAGAAKGLLCQILPAAERNRVCWPGLAALGSK